MPKSRQQWAWRKEDEIHGHQDQNSPLHGQFRENRQKKDVGKGTDKGRGNLRSA